MGGADSRKETTYAVWAIWIGQRIATCCMTLILYICTHVMSSSMNIVVAGLDQA